MGRHTEACETSILTSSPWSWASQTVRKVGGGPGWPQRFLHLLERGDAKSPDRARTLVNAPLWIMLERGTGRAMQLSAVLLSDRVVQAARARDSCGETPENHRRHRGSRKEEAGRRIARRDPGAGPEACRCSSQVPRPPDPRPRLPPRPSLPCPPLQEGLCCHLFLKAAWEPKSGGGWTASGSNTRGRGGERDNSDRTWCRNSGRRRGPGHFLGTSSGLCLPSREPWVQLCPVPPLPHCPPRVLRGTWLAVY